MASHVICNICNETISYTPNEVWKIGYHLQTKHSQEDVGHFFADADSGNEYSYRCTGRKQKMYKTTGILNALSLMNVAALLPLSFSGNLESRSHVTILH